MKFSTAALKFINQKNKSAGDPARAGIDELVKKIGTQLGSVEETVDFGAKYKGALIVKVVSCEPHPDSDHLHVCLIDDGGVNKKVERNTEGLIQVVCGAPNVKAGQTVVWLPPGMVVPETYAGEQFVLDARELRGVKSNGMIASLRELALGDDHTGILVLEADHHPGAAFNEAYHLDNDYIVDIENKMFTHRPDCFGWLGLAREIEGIHGRQYHSPRWYNVDQPIPKREATELKLEVRNEIPKLAPRFMAIAMSNVHVGPSPLWLRADLARVGLRSINNIVDLTNYMMMLTGQPLHAFDYDKVVAQGKGAKHATLVVRHPKKGEALRLLNGKEITPRAEAIMIATEKSLLGLAGVMGGGDTEVDETTHNIILECANFDMYSVRRTSMEHGIFTDAATRFTKGQSPLQLPAVMAKIVNEIRDSAHGKVASKLIDNNHLPKAVMERGSLYPPVRVTADFINSRLGSQLTTKEIAKMLTNVEFNLDVTGHDISVQAPFWRTDIEIGEDVVEEVGRLLGFSKLPAELPSRDTSAVNLSRSGEFKSSVRNLLAAAGANELQTYSFVPAQLLNSVSQNPQHAFKIRNALSPELQHYRLSLTPSLLDKVHPNIKAGYDEFALFEINKVHIKGDEDCDGLPREYQTVALTYAAKARPAGAAYYYAKRYLGYLLDELHVPYSIELSDHAPHWEIGRQIMAPFEPRRTGYVYVGAEHKFAGFVGEYHSAARRHLKLPATSAGFEIDLERLMQNQQANSYQPLPRFPSTYRDVTIEVKSDMPYNQVIEKVQKQLPSGDPELKISIEARNIYQDPKNNSHKQVTLRLKLQHFGHTLTADEANKIAAAVV